MANWILTQKGTVIPCRSIRRLTADERSDSNEVEAQKRFSFNVDITAKLSDSVKLPLNLLPDWVEPDWDSEPYGEIQPLSTNRLRLILLMQWENLF
jgi:hypothetical protein